MGNVVFYNTQYEVEQLQSMIAFCYITELKAVS